jgi:uncharacterized protein YabN with tetrapyrrole methylase and pyrophosphatase domain
VEATVQARGQELTNLDAQALDALWQQAKEPA